MLPLGIWSNPFSFIRYSLTFNRTPVKIESDLWLILYSLTKTAQVKAGVSTIRLVLSGKSRGLSSRCTGMTVKSMQESDGELGMIRKIALIAGAVVLLSAVVVLCIALTKPDEFRVETSTVIKAPPEKIFAVIGDLHRSPEWSPWENLDPNIKRTYKGPATGKGSVYTWSGNAEVGEGWIEVLEFDPPTKMVMNLHLVTPMEGDNTVEYVLQPQPDGTKMTWSMHGRNNLVGKIMQVFMNCEDMCGDAFQRGLANLKALCEK
jgi:uncharacterized protein YndB with AHSA1/START domain